MNPSASSGAPCLFLGSGFRPDEKEAIGTKIRALGSRFQNDKVYNSRTTHVICPKPMRSEKFLCACAAGKWILKPDFVNVSYEKRKWQREPKFEFGPGDAEHLRDVAQGLLSAPKRWREKVQRTGQGAFHGWKVHIRVENFHARNSVYTRVIEAGGGKCFPLNRADESLTHVIVDKCYEQEVKYLEERGIPCLVPEFLAEHLFEENPCMDRYRVSSVTMTPSQTSAASSAPNRTKQTAPGSDGSAGSSSQRQTPSSGVIGQGSNDSEGRGVKRKLHFCPNELREALQIMKKRKLSSPHMPLVPYTMLVPRPKKTFQCASDECVSRPFHTNMNNFVEAATEGKQWHEALNCVGSLISTEFYPPPAVLHGIMMQVLQNPSLHICQEAIHILKQVLCLHSPGSHPSIAKLYLQAMVPPSENGMHSYQHAHWTFLEAVIKRALDGQQVNLGVPEHPDEYSVKVAMETAESLLHFLVAVMEDDHLAAFSRMESPTNSRDKRDPGQSILGQVLWSGLEQASKKVSISTRELMKYFVRAVKMAAECHDWVPVANLVSMLVQMAAEISSWLGRKSSRKDPTKASEEARREFCEQLMLTAKRDGVMMNKSCVEMFLSLLKPPWLRQGVAECLLQGFSDQLLGEDASFWATHPLTMKKIVSYLFYLVPPSLVASSSTKKGEASNIQTVPKSSPLKTISNTAKQNGQSPSPRKKLNVNRRNIKGETPLHQACIKGDTEKVRELLESPFIDINAKDFAGWTPLHEACNHGKVNCVLELVKFAPGTCTVSGMSEKKTLDLRAAPDECGTTALHDAINNGHVEVVALLVQAGGKSLLSIKNKEGYTPVDLAVTAEMIQAINGEWVGAATTNDEKENLLNSHDGKSRKEMKSAQPHSSKYKQLIGCPSTNESRLVSEEESEKFAIIVMALLQSYVRSHDLHRVKSEIEVIKGQKRMLDSLPTNVRSLSLHENVPCTSTSLAPTLSQSSSTSDASSSSPLCTNNKDMSIDSVLEDMEVYADLSQHMEGFKSHLLLIGSSPEDDWTITNNNNNNKTVICKRVSRSMRLLKHLGAIVC